MDAARLIINPGSASRKYALARGGGIVLRGQFEKNGRAGVATYFAGGGREEREFPLTRFADTAMLFLDYARENRLLPPDTGGVEAVGLRIVAPGGYFAHHRKIDAAYLHKLEAAADEAPLHIKPELEELDHVRHALRRGIGVYAISDSAFHATMPDEARRYTFPETDAKKYELYRIGYHGISVSSVVRKLPEALGKLPERVVVAHLGGGASLTAVRSGQSIDTSMGLTPLEGIAMATRIGDVDPGALIRLGIKKKLSYKELEEYLNRECGLKGLSGTSAEMRELVEQAQAGQPTAEFALNAYAYRIRKYAGAFAAILGGLDALVFTATIGERSDYLRALVCKGLEGLGVRLDTDRNEAASDDGGVITADDSPVTAAVVPTDELAEMARQLKALT